VEIICWGFDPAMELERTGNTWPRGPTWGDLLRDVAAGKYNNGKPVQVRVLCWRDGLVSALARNTPGYGMFQAEQVKRIRHHERLSGKPHEAGMTPQERRDYFNALWFFDATHGTHSHLSFKVRACDSDKVRESLSKESKKIFPRMEAISFMEASTAHQKTILIDYDHAHGKHAVGYVMGLNSVTDYWDNGTPPELVRTPKPPPGQQEPYGNAEIAEELEALGIKTLAASLWTYDHTGRSTGDKYREIYIHSKLMIIDDAFFTLGSANLNLRSMAVDAEINIGCDDPLLSEKLRREVFSMHSGSAASCDGGNGTSSSIQSAFEAWQELLRVNRNKKASRKPLTGFLLPFSDVRTSSIRLA
jgi:hypothetical protein